MDAWTHCTYALPSPSPTSALADPPFRGTPGLGTWAFHSHPGPPDLERGWWGRGLGRKGLYTHQPLSRVVGPAGSGCSSVLFSRTGLMEIRAVALSTVAIKGERSVLYLCMDADGKMQGLVGASVLPDARGRGPAGQGGAQGQVQSFLVCHVPAGVELGGEGGEGPTTLLFDFLICKFTENG